MKHITRKERKTVNKIILKKQAGANIRKDGKHVRISIETDNRLEELSEATGRSKAYIADVLLKKAFDYVEISDEVEFC